MFNFPDPNCNHKVTTALLYSNEYIAYVSLRTNCMHTTGLVFSAVVNEVPLEVDQFGCDHKATSIFNLAVQQLLYHSIANWELIYLGEPNFG